MATKSQNSLYEISKEEVLYQLLKKEHGYYLAVFEITNQENQKLQDSHAIKEVLELLHRKKKLLGHIQEIDLTLSPLKKYWLAKTDKSDHLSQKIEAVLQEMEYLLGKILELHIESQKKLSYLMIDIQENC